MPNLDGYRNNNMRYSTTFKMVAFETLQKEPAVEKVWNFWWMKFCALTLALNRCVYFAPRFLQVKTTLAASLMMELYGCGVLRTMAALASAVRQVQLHCPCACDSWSYVSILWNIFRKKVVEDSANAINSPLIISSLVEKGISAQGLECGGSHTAIVSFGKD